MRRVLLRLVAVTAVVALLSALVPLLAGAGGRSPSKPTTHAGTLIEAGTIPGRLTFNGSYRPGTLRPWYAVAADGIHTQISRLHRSPRDIHISRQLALGSRVWAARFSVWPGEPVIPQDVPGIERTEIAASQRQTDGYPGANAWYGWEVHFPRSFRNPPGSASIFSQAKRVGGYCGLPNIALLVNSQPARPGSALYNLIRLRTDGGSVLDNTRPHPSGTPTDDCPGHVVRTFVIGHFRSDHWFHFVLHIGWSPESSSGYIEAWLDGKLVLPLTHTPTLYGQSAGAYWKQGLYQGFSPYRTSLYETGVRVGTSYSAVARPAPQSNPTSH